MDTIACHPQKESWINIIIAVFMGMIVGTASISACLMVTISWVVGPLLSTELKATLFFISGIVSAVLLRWFFLRETNLFVWTLTDDALIRGRSRPEIIPLNEVEKIILGLPARSDAFARVARFTHPQLWDVIESAKSQSILLMLKGGRMLPLYLHRTVNGTELMFELVRRLAHLVDQNYTFTEQQLKKLRRAEHNSILCL